MNKAILITGANGQLGNSIRRLAPEYTGSEFYFTDVDTLDILNKEQIAAFVQDNQIQYIVNCAAYTAVDRAEEDRDVAMRINCDAVRNIAEIAQLYDIKVIHISTDYVFDGEGTRPYKENDHTNPKSVYGATKLAGEISLQEICHESVIIRTAWLYSEYGSNFVKTMMRLGTERSELNVVSDQIGTPTYAGDLAMVILTIINYSTFVPGIYHYSNEGVCSWCDFAAKIMSLAQLDCLVHPISTNEYPTPAKRPAYSVLDKTKIKQIYGITIPEWEISLDRCLRSLCN